MSKFKTVLLSTIVVAVAFGALSSSCSVADEGSAMVMYAWPSEAAPEFAYIKSIAASYEDVKRWYDNVFSMGEYNGENATDYPNSDGSNDIPKFLYVKNNPQYATTRYNGACLPISKGKYTAICTVYDPVRNDSLYIVSNYSISVGDPGTKKYFEVKFDVQNVLDGKNDAAWSFKEYKYNPCPK
jgi:hypothetical protein